jgi:predicted dehydrogenase
VGSRAQDSAERFGDRYDIPNRHASYQALVEDPEVEVVYIATPHPMHRDDALLALRAGKPVLVEKPFTMNAAEAEEIVAQARGAKLFAMEAMWARFVPHMFEVRRVIESGVLGEIISVSADHGQWFERDASTRFFSPELGGGALLDLGVYTISFASMVLGTPDRIVAISEPAFTGVDAQTSMLFSYASGAHAVLNCTVCAKSPTRGAIVGTEGRIEIDGDDFYAPNSFTVFPRGGEPTRYEMPHEGHGIRHQADEVARCLRAGKLESDILPLDETVSVMRTIDAVFASAELNQ